MKYMCLTRTSMSSLTCSCWSLNSPKASIMRPVSKGEAARLSNLQVSREGWRTSSTVLGAQPARVWVKLPESQSTRSSNACSHRAPSGKNPAYTEARSWEGKGFSELTYILVSLSFQNLISFVRVREFNFLSHRTLVSRLLFNKGDSAPTGPSASLWCSSHLKYYFSISKILRLALDHFGDCDIHHFSSV